jgi:pyruvate/2-oxoglutarate dehydrogenase complex dihydrolipoamide dehydrogenase (E3) component
VTVIDPAPRLLGGEEPEVSKLLAEVFADDGITVRTSTDVKSVYHDGGRFTLLLGDTEAIAGERLLVAAGRAPDLSALGVASLGLDGSGSHLEVDGRQRVAGVDGMWAVGDVTGEGAFTHVAMAQADVAVRDILDEPSHPVNKGAIPRVTFTDPEIASVGMSEQRARDAGASVRVGMVDLAASARGWINGPGTKGLIKLVEDARRGVLIGATSVGPCGGEVLGLLSLAVHAEVPVDRLRDLVYAYPTFHRSIGDAVKELKAV